MEFQNIFGVIGKEKTLRIKHMSYRRVIQGLTNQSCHTFIKTYKIYMPIIVAFQATYRILMKLAFKLGGNMVLEFLQREVLMKFITP